jgi:site-specific DNA-methyltransferase (adenine-specific)
MKWITKGPIFLTFNEKWTRTVENSLQTLSIPIIQRLQWYFTFGQDQTKKGRYAPCYRPLYWLNSNFVIPENIKIPSARQTKYHDKRAAKGGKMPPNVWEFPRVCGTFRSRRTWHPTQLNEELVRRIIIGHCPSLGTVLDPFIGSGTTARICRQTGRNCVGIDASSFYIAKIKEELGIET